MGNLLETGAAWLADQLKANWAEDKRWLPDMIDAERKKGVANWQKAVTRTYDWVEDE